MVSIIIIIIIIILCIINMIVMITMYGTLCEGNKIELNSIELFLLL